MAQFRGSSRRRQRMRQIRFGMVLLLLGAAAPAQDDKQQVDVAIRDDSFTLPPDLMLRARVVAMTPAEPTSIQWRWGGEGLGGTPEKGVIGENLAIGAWSPSIAVASFVKGKFPGKLFVTFMVGRGGKRNRETGRNEGCSTGVELEFE